MVLAVDYFAEEEVSLRSSDGLLSLFEQVTFNFAFSLFLKISLLLILELGLICSSKSENILMIDSSPESSFLATK